jgi:hypothetical protein
MMPETFAPKENRIKGADAVKHYGKDKPVTLIIKHGFRLTQSGLAASQERKTGISAHFQQCRGVLP